MNYSASKSHPLTSNPIPRHDASSRVSFSPIESVDLPAAWWEIIPAGSFDVAWSPSVVHPTLPQGKRVPVEQIAPLEQLLLGPAEQPDGRLNIFGGLRKTMATVGRATIKDLQKAEMMIASPRS